MSRKRGGTARPPDDSQCSSCSTKTTNPIINLSQGREEDPPPPLNYTHNTWLMKTCVLPFTSLSFYIAHSSTHTHSSVSAEWSKYVSCFWTEHCVTLTPTIAISCQSVTTCSSLMLILAVTVYVFVSFALFKFKSWSDIEACKNQYEQIRSPVARTSDLRKHVTFANFLIFQVFNNIKSYGAVWGHIYSP